MSQFELRTISAHDAAKGLMPTLNELRIGEAVIISKESPNLIDEVAYARFTEDHALSIGREHSMHDVTFGDFAITTASDKLLSCPLVAVKPYPKQWPWLAEHDFVISRMLDAATSQRMTYQTVGFLRNHRGEIAGITEFEQGVQSCDNLLYGNRHEQATNETVRLALATAVKSLFILNNESLVHGDFFPRNTAVDHALQPRIIDLTTIRKATKPEDFLQDIHDYSRSVLQPDWGAPVTGTDLIDLVLTPYLKAVPDILPASARKSVAKSVGKLMLRLSSVTS